ncbi:competence protein [Cellulomonas sp. WB94]|uniref:CinA family protein n=1 Tax=Cellulomonas sp. WB94 TaxID=2173174 RepID=UPI000D563493|nr:CinA family protein [Cellulomonas sp. WB94]PVU81656.1 competence protein [Cellulomonas sp. WB94]
MTDAPTVSEGLGPETFAAAALLDALAARGWSVAVAESLTGGLVIACLVDVPGASSVVRGGVVAYATDLKATLLGVDPELLAARGPVDPDVAMAMAQGVRHLLGADVGLATTGVAGPDPQGGHVPGTVHLAVAAPTTTEVRSLLLTGGRGEVRAGARAAVLELALEVVGAHG